MKKFLPPFFFLTLLIGCNINELDFKDLNPPLLDGTFAIPVGYVSYTMRELIDSIGDTGLDLTEDSTSLLFLTYRDTAQFNSGTNLIAIDDVTNTGSVLLEGFTNPGPDAVAVDFDSVFTFNYPANENEEVDSIFYETGTLEIEINKSFPNKLIYNLTIQNTRTVDGNLPVNFSGNLPEGSFSTSPDIQQDLIGYKTILSFQNNENTFEFSVALDVELAPGESISSTDFVTFNLSYLNQSFEIIYGKFGQDTTNIGNQVIDVDFFADLGETGLEFGAPVITFDFQNSYGVPLGALFNGMYGVEGDSITGDTTYLTGPITSNPQVIDPAETLGESVATSILVDRNNSSIQELLSSSPNQIGFDLSAVSNPQDPSGSNFIMNDSEVVTFIELYMPLEISLKNLTREFEFDLGNGLDFNEADSLSLRLVSENGLPFSAFLEFEIQNDSLGTNYTVPTTLVLESAFLDSRGIVNEKRRTISDIPVGTAGVEALKNGGNLFLRFILNTPGNTSRNSYIKVLGDYDLNIQLSIVGKVNYQP